MGRKINTYKSRWFKTDFYVENDLIKERPSSDFAGYDPFDFYFRKGGQSLYLEFTAIDVGDDRQIEEFVNKYGVLGLELRKQNKEILDFLDCRLDDFLHSMVWSEDFGKKEDTCYPVWGGLWFKRKWCQEPWVEKQKLAFEEYRKLVFPDDDGEKIITAIEAEFSKLSDYVPDSVIVEKKQAFINELLLLRSLVEGDAALKSGDIAEVVATLEKLLLLEESGYTAKLSQIDDLAWINIKTDTELYINFMRGNFKELSDYSEIPSFFTDIIPDRLKRKLASMIAEIMGFELEFANQVFKKESDGTSSIKWQCHDLLSALYVMFFLDMTGGVSPRVCRNERCDEIFKPKDARQIYCSFECKNAQIQREHRKRHYGKKP